MELHKRRSTRWGLAIAILAAVPLGIVAFAVLLGISVHWAGHPNPSPGGLVASAAGGSLVAIPIWATLYFLFVRRRAPEHGLRYLIVLAATVIITNMAIAGLLILSTKHNAEFQRKSATESAISEIRTAVLESNNPGTYAVDLHSRSNGDAGILGRTTKRYLLSISDDNAACGPTKPLPVEIVVVLAGNFPRDFVELDQFRAAVTSRRASIQAYWQRRAQHLSEFRSAIANSAVDAATKSAALVEFDDAGKKAEPARSYERALETTELSDLDALASSCERWLRLRKTHASHYQQRNAAAAAERHLYDSRAAAAALEAFEAGFDAPRK